MLYHLSNLGITHENKYQAFQFQCSLVMSKFATKALVVPLMFFFLCSLIQTIALTPPPNNANMDMRDVHIQK